MFSLTARRFAGGLPVVLNFFFFLTTTDVVAVLISDDDNENRLSETPVVRLELYYSQVQVQHAIRTLTNMSIMRCTGVWHHKYIDIACDPCSSCGQRVLSFLLFVTNNEIYMMNTVIADCSFESRCGNLEQGLIGLYIMGE